MDRIAFILGGVVVAALGGFLGDLAHAEPWPKVAFAEWPRVTPSTITKPEAPLFRSDLPGSVQPKPRAPVPAPRLCNERQPLGYWLLVPCFVSSKDFTSSFPRNADPEQSALLNPPS